MPPKSGKREERGGGGGGLCKALPVGAVHVTWLVVITLNEYNKQNTK